MLEHVAECLPELEALIVWESAIRHRLVTLPELRRIAWPRLAAARLARVASAESDSLLETIAFHRLLALRIPVRQQVHLRGHRVDLLLGRRLVVQVDGFRFHTAAQRRRDIEHDGLLGLDGYTVLRFAYGDIVDRWDHVEDLILRHFVLSSAARA